MNSLAVLVLIASAALPGADEFDAAFSAEQAARYGDAASAYEMCAKADPALAPWARARAALCRAQSGDASGAIGELRARLNSHPDGPWRPMVHLRLAELLAEAGKHADAAAAYDNAVNLRPSPWWFEPHEWARAANLLDVPGRKAEGLAYFRDIVNTTGYRARRKEAAAILARSDNTGDLLDAAEGYVRSNAYAEGQRILALVEPRVQENGTLLTQWRHVRGRALIGSGQRSRGVAMLEEVVQGDPKGPLAGPSLYYAMLGYAGAGNDRGVRDTFERIAANYSASSAFTDAAWRYAGRLEDQEHWKEAIREYRRFAHLAPNHYRADDALVRASGIAWRTGEPEEALALLDEMLKRFPASSLWSEAAFERAKILEGQGDSEAARRELQRAASKGTGDYYAHRAWQRLHKGQGGGDGTTPIRVDSQTVFLRTFALADEPAGPPPAALADDVRFQRLALFGGLGLEEAEWEAAALLADPPAGVSDADIYVALGEAGVAYTAMRHVQSNSWGLEGGTPALSRWRVMYPRAYWPQVVAMGSEFGVDPYLILAVARQESTFRPAIKSHAGATGVMQVMPSTARWLADVDPAIELRHAEHIETPGNALRLGAVYLRRMLERTDGNVALALAAYNAGPGNLNKWRKRYDESDLDEFIERIPFNETRDYVKRVLGNYAAYLTLYPDAAPALTAHAR